MKYVSLLLMLLCTSMAFTQTTTTQLTMTGIGDIKVGMQLSALEKIMGQSIKLKKRVSEEAYTDTAVFSYKGNPYEVLFVKNTDDKEKTYLSVYQVRTNSSQIKTKSGISIGDDKLKIITTYDGYSIHIDPTYEGENFSIKSKNKSTVTLYSDEGNNIITFYLENNKVTAMSVGVFEGC